MVEIAELKCFFLVKSNQLKEKLVFVREQLNIAYNKLIRLKIEADMK